MKAGLLEPLTTSGHLSLASLMKASITDAALRVPRRIPHHLARQVVHVLEIPIRRSRHLVVHGCQRVRADRVFNIVNGLLQVLDADVALLDRGGTRQSSPPSSRRRPRVLSPLARLDSPLAGTTPDASSYCLKISWCPDCIAAVNSPPTFLRAFLERFFRPGPTRRRPSS